MNQVLYGLLELQRGGLAAGIKKRVKRLALIKEVNKNIF
jgi:hypothetical protein